MMKTIMSCFCLALILTGGCGLFKTPEPIIIEKTVQEFQRPDVAGTTIAPGDIQTIREPESVRSYHTGRYIDPNNPDIMYEASMLYVVDENAVWNKRPNQPPYHPNYNRLLTVPEPVAADLQLKTEALDRTNKLMARLGTELIKAREEMQKQATQANKSMETTAKILQDIQKTQQLLQDDLKKMKLKVADLEAKQK